MVERAFERVHVVVEHGTKQRLRVRIHGGALANLVLLLPLHFSFRASVAFV